MPTATRSPAGARAAVVGESAGGGVGEGAECCSSLVGQVVGLAEAEQLAARLRALADPTRLRLVSLVAAQVDAEACVCELVGPVGLSQPTVSHHLKILVEAGILTREQRGKWAYYGLRRQALEQLAESITG